MYSRIYTRLPWFFDYIGEPQEDFIPDLYGDVNFDGSLNINDIVLIEFKFPIDHPNLTLALIIDIYFFDWAVNVLIPII